MEARMSTPLHLDKYFFPVAQTIADAEFEEKGGEVADFTPQIKLNYKAPKQGNVYQVALEITIQPDDEDHLLPYNVNLIAIGMFRVAEGWDDPVKMILVNGASILYSAAREFIITLTSRGPWNHMIIPTYNFLQHYKEHHVFNEEDEDKNLEKTSDVAQED
jgi:preprotein translocase subunit SecB